MGWIRGLIQNKKWPCHCTQNMRVGSVNALVTVYGWQSPEGVSKSLHSARSFPGGKTARSSGVAYLFLDCRATSHNSKMPNAATTTGTKVASMASFFTSVGEGDNVLTGNGESRDQWQSLSMAPLIRETL